jgi:hypothetical protein
LRRFLLLESADVSNTDGWAFFVTAGVVNVQDAVSRRRDPRPPGSLSEESRLRLGPRRQHRHGLRAPRNLDDRPDNWIGQVASAAMNGPEWASTALFITYDDCGCFYDQVPGVPNPDGTAQGPRSPLLIISPCARPGYTDSTPTTFAVILAYVEHTFGVRSLAQDDANAYGFANAFNYSQKPLAPARMVQRPLPASARRSG